MDPVLLQNDVLPLPDERQRDAQEWMFRSGIPVLPYSDGVPRFSSGTMVLPTRQVRALYNAARSVGRMYDELRAIVMDRPHLLKEYFSLTPMQEALWYTSGGQWRGIARADLFMTDEGTILAAELNSDTPSGMDEAFLLGQFARERSAHYHDPNMHLPHAFLTVIEHALRSVRRPAGAERPSVGIIYPTDIPEDMGLLTLYRLWLEENNYSVTFGAPRNLRKNPEGRVSLFGTEIDILIRHYKTDWWCEQISPWKGTQASADILPLVSPYQEIIAPMIDGHLAVVNPFGCILTQNKLTLAFFHEHRSLFSAETQKQIAAHIPVTLRLSRIDPQVLLDEQQEWVLKSNYGCEGAEVIIGRATERSVWEASVREAVPEYWIAQRYFSAVHHDEGIDNFGVYLAGNEPCGLYLRRDAGMTTAASGVVPVLERTHRAETHPPAAPRMSRGPRIDAVTEDLLDAYLPDERWLPFRMPLLLYSAREIRDTAASAHEDVDLRTERSTALLAGILGSAATAERCALMMVCDLPGVKSAAVAAGLSSTATIVLQMENIPHQHEEVPLQSILRSLMFHADTIRTGRWSGLPSSERPPLFVLAQERLTRRTSPDAQFNNRHWAYLPSSAPLRERGITTILLLQEEGGGREQDDLHEAFLQYQQNGIRICSLSLSSLQQREDLTLQELLQQSVVTVTARATIFASAPITITKQ